MGGLTGLIVDLSQSGVNVDFVDEVSKALIPGKSAVVAEVQETWETPVDSPLGKLRALVFRRLRSEVVEDQLVREAAAFEAELTQLEAELAQATAEGRRRCNSRSTAVEQKLAATRAVGRGAAAAAEERDWRRRSPPCARRWSRPTIGEGADRAAHGRSQGRV